VTRSNKRFIDATHSNFVAPLHHACIIFPDPPRREGGGGRRRRRRRQVPCYIENYCLKAVLRALDAVIKLCISYVAEIRTIRVDTLGPLNLSRVYL
jgi:hypothetical protein